jgi:hypothetical protein
MADYKQCSDSAQTGPGFSTAFKPKSPYVPAPKPTASSPSGQTQSENRGTDNKAK